MSAEWEYPASMPTLVVGDICCSHCGTAVQFDHDVAWCEECRVRWSEVTDGADSVPDLDWEGADVPCGITPAPCCGLIHGPCILPSGHTGGHETPSRIFAVSPDGSAR